MKKLNHTLYILFLISAIAVNAQSETVKKLAPLTDPVSNCELRYYYFPNLEAYFDTKTSNYILTVNGQWTTLKEIPSGYRGYSLYNRVCVMITDYDGDQPIQFLKAHKKKYPYNNRGKYQEMTASISD